MSETKLKPCAHCDGNEPYIMSNAFEYFVRCRGCWADGGTGKTEAEAEAAWNRRDNEAEILEMFEKRLDRHCRSCIGGYCDEKGCPQYEYKQFIAKAKGESDD